MVTPKKNVYPKKMIKKNMVTPKNLAYCIARGFIIAFRKNGAIIIMFKIVQVILNGLV